LFEHSERQKEPSEFDKDEQVSCRRELFAESNGTTEDMRSLVTTEETTHQADIDTCIQGNPGSVSVRAKLG
jgi:hypothetical protein